MLGRRRLAPRLSGGEESGESRFPKSRVTKAVEPLHEFVSFIESIEAF